MIALLRGIEPPRNLSRKKDLRQKKAKMKIENVSRKDKRNFETQSYYFPNLILQSVFHSRNV